MCVRLLKGQYDRQTVYSDPPLDVARRFWEQGARQLHCVDLDGARNGRFSEHKVLNEILERYPFTVQVGGGIRTLNQARELIELGVDRLVIGTLALRSPLTLSKWINELGPERFCISVDVRDGTLAMEGWTAQSEVSLDSAVHVYRSMGVKRFLCTDVSVDGTLSGPSLELYRDLLHRFPKVEWIASGGVASPANLRELADIGVQSVVVGKAFYEGRFTYRDALQTVSGLNAEPVPC
jgi:phosphoribosylformimino-5-aminoimidazole carboxamide ribotide isomerase